MTEHAPQGPQTPVEGQLLTAPHPLYGEQPYPGSRDLGTLADLDRALGAKEPAQVSVITAPESAPVSVAVSAPESTPVNVPVAVGGRHSAPEANGAPVASEFSVDSIKSRLAAESAPHLPVVPPRAPAAAEKVGFADRSREAARKTGGNIFRSALNKSKQLRDYIKVGIKAEGTQVIGFRDIAHAAKDGVSAAKAKVGERYEQGKQRQRAEWQTVRDGFVTAGRTARAHKDVWVASLEHKAAQDREKVRKTYETTKNVAKVGATALAGAGLVASGAVILGAGATYRGAKAGAKYAGKGLAYGGNAVAQVSYEAGAATARGAKAAGKATKRGALKTAEYAEYGAVQAAIGATIVGLATKEVASATGDKAVDARAAVAAFRARRADPQRKVAKFEAKKQKAAALRAKAEARRAA